MKEQVNFYKFCRGFETMNRNENFSYEGKQALFDYLEQYEEDLGQEIEFDVIALCCEYSEYENIEEFLKEHDTDLDKKDFDNLEDFEEAVKEEIQDNTQFIDIDGTSFIIQQY